MGTIVWCRETGHFTELVQVDFNKCIHTFILEPGLRGLSNDIGGIIVGSRRARMLISAHKKPPA
jgi:hypothetical protein